MTHKVILVFDANQRSALASVRTLGKREDCIVYTCDETTSSLAGASKYSFDYLVHPSIKQSPSEFINWLREVIETKNITHLFPVTEISSRTILQHKDHLKANLPFADIETVLTVSDKNKLMAKAIQLQLPVPSTLFFETSNDIQKEQLSYPCVLKPSLSRVLYDGKWVDTKVDIIQNEEQLLEVLEHTEYLRHLPFMIQEYIEGFGAGIFTYYQRGIAKAFFAHHRIREKPPQGGVSVLSKSVSVDATMKEYSERLLNAVSWHGAAMIEYRVSKDGIPFLMEINARLWGSLQLAIDSGVDFPSLLVDGESKTPLKPVTVYKINQELRWLLGDLDNLYLTWKSSSIPIRSKIKATLCFLIPFSQSRRYEVNRLGDLRPFWFELRSYLGLIK